MSDDDVDDKIPPILQSTNSTNPPNPTGSITQQTTVSENTSKPIVNNIYISKSSKFRQSSQSDDDNIEIEGQLGDIDKEFERATQELILKTIESDKMQASKCSAKKSKQNDDSDKSDSSSESGIWGGVHNDDDIPVDIDKLLGNMKNMRRNNMEDLDDGNGFDNSHFEDLSTKIDEVSTSVDNLEESFGELNKKVDRMNRNIKKILDMMNILAGNPESIKSKKYDIVDVNDKNDPVNNTSYFTYD